MCCSRADLPRCHIASVTLEPSDEALVDRTLAGDREAFGLLVRRHRRACLARALAIVADHAEAEDVAQEALVHAYEQLSTCRQPSRFLPWLLTIVRNRALNRLRAIKRRRTVGLADTIVSSNTVSPTHDIERREIRRTLLEALGQLLPVQREVVLLADLEQWSHLQISEALGISVVMSRRHLSDARARLRTLLANTNHRA